jgi:hypothetical protein
MQRSFAEFTRKPLRGAQGGSKRSESAQDYRLRRLFHGFQNSAALQVRLRVQIRFQSPGSV